MTTAPGDGLRHPVAVAALAIWLLNDHLWKGWLPGAFTGKASDVAGLIFFPLFLVALWETARAATGHRTPPSRAALWTAIVATGTTFAAIEVVPLAERAWCVAIGVARWPWNATVAAITGGTAVFAPVQVTADPTDLATLPALALAFHVGRRRVAQVVPGGWDSRR